MELWYDATGAKQKKTVTGAGGYTKEYANGVEYKDGELEAIYTGDGRIIYEPATTDDDGNLIPERYRYEFTLLMSEVFSIQRTTLTKQLGASPAADVGSFQTFDAYRAGLQTCVSLNESHLLKGFLDRWLFNESNSSRQIFEY